MDVKKLLTAAAAGFVVMYVLSYLWHQVLLAETYSLPQLQRDQPDMMPIVLAHVVLALLMAYMYPIGYKGGSPAAEGFRFGALIGLVATAPLSLIFVGVWHYPMNVALIDSAWHIIEQGLMGVAIAMIYGTGAND